MVSGDTILKPQVIKYFQVKTVEDETVYGNV